MAASYSITDISLKDLGIKEKGAFRSRPDSQGNSQKPSPDDVGTKTPTRTPCPRCGSHMIRSRVYHVVQNNPVAAVKKNYSPPIVDIYYEECPSAHFKRQLQVVKSTGFGVTEDMKAKLEQ